MLIFHWKTSIEYKAKEPLSMSVMNFQFLLKTDAQDFLKPRPSTFRLQVYLLNLLSSIVQQINKFPIIVLDIE